MRSRPTTQQVVRRILQFALPLAVVASALWAVAAMFANMEQPAAQPPPQSVPLVRTVAAVPGTLHASVHSQGTVEPHTTVALAPQVSGRVVAVAPELRSGGFFAAGQVLFRIDDTDFRLAVVQRQADVARARLRLAQETAEAGVAERAWQQLEGDRRPDGLATRRLYVQEAEAALAAAEAALQRAELDLGRTAVALPFDGRVRSADLDVGSQVQAGQPVAEVYGIDFAEVRLPIPDVELAFLDLPLGNGPGGNRDGNGGGAPPPAVELTAEFAGRRHTWRGTVTRTEGEIDRRTRQLTLVARVADPYAKGEDPARPPLAVGMFVEARIAGRTFRDVITLPRAALRPDGTVLVVASEDRLQARPVDVLRLDRRTVSVRDGLAAGDRVCISPIEVFVEGMPVRVLDPETPPPVAPAGPGNGGR